MSRSTRRQPTVVALLFLATSSISPSAFVFLSSCGDASQVCDTTDEIVDAGPGFDDAAEVDSATDVDDVDENIEPDGGIDADAADVSSDPELDGDTSDETFEVEEDVAIDADPDATMDPVDNIVTDVDVGPDVEMYGVFPTTVSEDYAQGVYETWLTDWVVACPSGSLRVKWTTETLTVSEGIGYGMLLAASWADRATFDGFWQYYTEHINDNGLMSWLGDCNGSSDPGAASDADLDAAMALIMADCVWPEQGYGALATTLIGNIRSALLREDGTHTFLCAGDSWGADCCGNASYQAPAYYRAFGLHTGDTEYWNSAAEDTYFYLYTNNYDTTGLVSDWMDPDTLQCDAKNWVNWHGLDASRVPWRVTVDYMWWNDTAGYDYANVLAAFVVSEGGVANTCAGYTLDGVNCGGPAQRAFAGAFATTGIATDQTTVDTFFEDLLAVENVGYFHEILNALYLTTAVGRFEPGCY